jgi:AraC-like DNA-binding protein
MIYREYIPHPVLAGLIKCYWIFENHYGENHCERMIPDGNIDLVFHYGQRPRLLIDGKEITKQSAFLGGHLISPALLKFSGDLKMFGIKFHPWASATLYPMPAAQLNNLRIPVEEITGSRIKQHYQFITDNLNLGRYGPVIKLMDTELLKLFSAAAVPNPLLKKSFEYIRASNGLITIDELSRALGCGARNIQKTFQEKKGMTAGFFARLTRLHHTIKLALKNPAVTSTQMAYENGYFDQAHFIKDFARFTGLSPKKFFREEHIYISQNSAS